MAALSGVPSVTIFQEARDSIEQNVTEIIQSLNNKRIELFEEINRLEKEFKHKQQQQQKELNKLHSMKTRTEEELGENSLAETQQSVILALEIGIDKLSLEVEPNYRIEIKWGICMKSLPSKIGESEIEVVQLTPVTTTQQQKQTYTRRRRDRGNRRRQNPAGTPDGNRRQFPVPKNMLYPRQAPDPKDMFYSHQFPVPKNMYPPKAPVWEESWNDWDDDLWS